MPKIQCVVNQVHSSETKQAHSEMGPGCPILVRRIVVYMCEQGQCVIFDMRKLLMIALIDCSATTFESSQEDDNELNARVLLLV